MSAAKSGSRVAKVGSASSKTGSLKSNSKSPSSSVSVSRTAGVSASEARNAARALASPYSEKSTKSIAARVLSRNLEPFPVKTYKVAGSSLTQRQGADVVRKVAKKASKKG